MGEKTQTLNCAALLGDVHGEADLLQAALTFLAERTDLDAILCTGDIPGRNGDADRCRILLENAGVLTICGNHDRWQAEDAEHYAEVGLGEPLTQESRQYLRDLPPVREFDTPRGPLLLCHGLGSDDMAGVYPGGDDAGIEQVLRSKGLDRFAFIVAGHTHRRMLRPVGRTVLLNPGTLLSDLGPGFLIADIAENIVQVYDIEPISRAITLAAERTLP